MDIKASLKNSTKDLLSAEALSEIETIFNEAVIEKAALTIEVALAKQDDDHAAKVSTLLEAIDTDHTSKLERIVDAITANHTNKLVTVVEKYNTSVVTDATNYKNTLVESISNYLDLYLEEIMPKSAINEAVSNKRAATLLGDIKHYLGVNEAVAMSSIRSAIADGKSQLDEANSKASVLVTTNEKLHNELSKYKTTGLLEGLTKGFGHEKKEFITRILSDKTSSFISENFKYTCDLFDKEKATLVEQLKTEAGKQVKSNVDPVIVEQFESTPSVVTADASYDADPLHRLYMKELGKY